MKTTRTFFIVNMNNKPQFVTCGTMNGWEYKALNLDAFIGDLLQVKCWGSNFVGQYKVIAKAKQELTLNENGDIVSGKIIKQTSNYSSLVKKIFHKTN